MNHRTAATIVASFLFAALAAPCQAELSKIYVDWAAGPAQLLLTKAERDEWGRITTDQHAENFIRLFWARRDPDPATADNEFQREFERRAAYADERFAHKNKDGEEVRGSLTDRGRVFILLGPPRRLQRPGAGGVTQGGDFGFGEETVSGAGSVPSGSGPGRFGRGGSYEGLGVASEEIWIYEDDRKPEVIKKRREQIRFRTKPGTEEVDLYQGEEALAYTAEAAERAIVHPELTIADLAPAAGPSLSAESDFGAWGAEVVGDPGGVDALHAALGGEGAAAAVDAHLDTGAFQASDGTWIVPVQVSTAGARPGGTALVGELVNAEGECVVAFRSDRDWQDLKGQQVVKATVVAPPGSYQLRAGLESDTGQVVWKDAEAVEVPAAADDFWVSEIVLSDHIFPMPTAQQMLEPYAWQGIVVVPKGDRTFAQGDVLWYYLHACQPKLTAEGKPNLRVTVQLTGPESFRGPVGIDPVKAGDRCWVVAQGLDLVPDRFPAGEYGIQLYVRDSEAGKTLTAAKTDFKVTAAGGS